LTSHFPPAAACGYGRSFAERSNRHAVHRKAGKKTPPTGQMTRWAALVTRWWRVTSAGAGRLRGPVVWQPFPNPFPSPSLCGSHYEPPGTRSNAINRPPAQVWPPGSSSRVATAGEASGPVPVDVRDAGKPARDARKRSPTTPSCAERHCGPRIASPARSADFAQTEYRRRDHGRSPGRPAPANASRLT
jgi:hypothetical protein